MYEMKSHKFRYRPKLYQHQETSTTVNENSHSRTFFRVKMQKIMGQSTDHSMNQQFRKAKMELQPIENKEKVTHKPYSLSKPVRESQSHDLLKNKYPVISGDFFYKPPKAKQKYVPSPKSSHPFSTFKNNEVPSPEIVLNRTTKSHLRSSEAQFFADSIKNKRPYNEDRYVCKQKCLGIKDAFFKPLENSRKQYSLYGVFDGHGGSQCAQFIKNNISNYLASNKNLFTEPMQALKETIERLEEKFLSLCEKKAFLETSGSCAIVILVLGKKYYIANVGDSRALSLSIETATQLTVDHKPEDKDEKLRILQHGGKLYREELPGKSMNSQVKLFSQTRIMPGSLNVSRTLGDIQIKNRRFGGSPGMIIATPDIHVYDFREGQYLLVASDGLFQGLTNEQIHQIFLKVKSQYAFADESKILSKIGQELLKKSSQVSRDNVTLILLNFF